MILLVVAGFFIFPLTQLLLRLMGHRASLPKGHPMNALAMQTAFIVPICLPLIGGATICHHSWFYPALMILVGAHYLPFIFLYGMPEFAALAGLLIVGGLLFALYFPMRFAAPGWFTACVLIMFGLLANRLAQRRV